MLMDWHEQLTEKLTALSKAEFNYTETNDISQASKIGLDCTGIYMEATVIYFEIKNFEYLLETNGRQKMAQVYTMYHDVLASIAEKTGAFINCYLPEAFLVIYPGTKDNFCHGVRSALKIANAFANDFKKQFSIISGLEFAMGMDHGHIMGTKTLSDNDLERITWFGSCILKAKKICSQCARPYHVGISSILYHNLTEDLLIKKKSILGLTKRIDLWNRVSYQHGKTKKHLYQSNHKISMDETQ